MTEELKNKVYIDENKVVYLALEDVRELFDKNIRYDEKEQRLITTSRTKVATMQLGEKYINVNDALLDTMGTLIEKDGRIYIPISNLGIVYNIEINYIQDTDVVTIDELSKALTKATIMKDTNLKLKMRKFSSTLGKLEQGEQVSLYEDKYVSWIKVRTASGKVGYVQKSNLTNTYEIRQDMDVKSATDNISASELVGWISISNKDIETDELKDYITREARINAIVGLALSENAKGVKIEISKEYEGYMDFIIELTPRLREIGIPVGVKLIKKSDKKIMEDIVDYIVTE